MSVVLGTNSMVNAGPIERYDLSSDLAEYIPEAFPWCWKRDGEKDGEPYNRIVFYRPVFHYDDEAHQELLDDVEFYYRHEGPIEIIRELALTLIAHPAKRYR